MAVPVRPSRGGRIRRRSPRGGSGRGGRCRDDGGDLPPDTRLATLILAHNETGAIQPVARLAALAAGRHPGPHRCRAGGRPDPGRLPRTRGGHPGGERQKFHGPSGPVCCWWGKGSGWFRLFSAVDSSRRPPGDARRPPRRRSRPRHSTPAGRGRRAAGWVALRDRLEAGLIAGLGPSHVRNGPARRAVRLPQTSNVGFPGLDGDALLMQLDLAGIAASRGPRAPAGPCALAVVRRHARTRRPPPLLGPLQPRRDHHRSRDR